MAFCPGPYSVGGLKDQARSLIAILSTLDHTIITYNTVNLFGSLEDLSNLLPNTGQQVQSIEMNIAPPAANHCS